MLSLFALISTASANQAQFHPDANGVTLRSDDIAHDLHDISTWLGATPDTWGSGLGPKDNVFSFLELLETDIDSVESTCTS